MATDEFDDILNEAERKGVYDPTEPDELELEEYKIQRLKTMKMEARLQGDEQAKLAGKFYTDSWIEGLKEAGISQKEYNELVAQDPEGAKKLVKDSIKAVARTVAARKGKVKRDSRTGQFIKGPAPTTPDLGKAKENKDVDAVLEALFPDNDPMFQY